MLDIVSIAADLLADMPEFMHLSYYSNLVRLYRRNRAMNRYTRLMQVEATPFLLLGLDPDVSADESSQVEAQLHVHAGGISWTGSVTGDKGKDIRWESYVLPPEVLERIAGREAT